jgi:hypothetical protein
MTEISNELENIKYGVKLKMKKVELMILENAKDFITVMDNILEEASKLGQIQVWKDYNSNGKNRMFGTGFTINLCVRDIKNKGSNHLLFVRVGDEKGTKLDNLHILSMGIFWNGDNYDEREVEQIDLNGYKVKEINEYICDKFNNTKSDLNYFYYS